MSDRDDMNHRANAWISNASIEEVAERLKGARRVVILTHSKPDGDAVGSTLALARALACLEIKATPAYLDPWPARFDPIVGSTPIVREHAGMWDSAALKDPDLIVIVDTGSWNQVADARQFIQARMGRTIVVDHHGHGDITDGTMRHINVSYAAACEPVARICSLLLGAKLKSLPPDVAEPLYLGIASDTGWFRYSNTTAQTFRLAAALIDAGANADRIFQIAEQSDSPERILLMQRALSSLRLLDDNRVAVMTLRRKDFEETGTTDDEAGGLIDLPRSVGTVRVTLLATEVEPALTKVSFRSKAGDDEIDVNLIAQRFDGGGHKHAAGAKIKATVDETVERILGALIPGA